MYKRQAFARLMEGRTSFIVAHRLSTLREADVILVMKDGKVDVYKRQVLEYLYKKYDLYVVTNGVEATQRSRLKLSGIERFMKDVFVSEAVGYQKPQNEFFDYCFAHIDGFEKEKAMIIGDSLTSDIQGGNNAGVACCWFNPSGKERSLELRIDKEIKSLKELLQFL